MTGRPFRVDWRTEGVEKACARLRSGRGLSRCLAEAGVSSDTAFGFADEMRVGLRGMVRRAWGRRGVKVVQRVQVEVPVLGTRCSEGEVGMEVDRLDEVR